MAEKTTLSKIREGSESVKTVVPPGVRSFLELEAGDSLSWEISLDQKGNKWIKVTKN